MTYKPSPWKEEPQDGRSGDVVLEKFRRYLSPQVLHYFRGAVIHDMEAREVTEKEGRNLVDLLDCVAGELGYKVVVAGGITRYRLE